MFLSSFFGNDERTDFALLGEHARGSKPVTQPNVFFGEITMNVAQHEAVRLAALGISVIRVARGQKCPLEQSWIPFTERPRTVDEARRDFSSASNIAIVTGSVSGLVGVDCDSDKAEQWAQTNLPPSQMMVRTPGGGLHIYYRYPPGSDVRCAVKRLGIALDVRATRGYLLCPDSSDSHGAPYHWVHGPPTEQMLGGLPTFDPNWLAQQQSVRPVRPLVGGGASRRQRGRRYISRIVAQEHNRGHDSTYRATQVLREFGLSASEAYEELVLWNRTNALPPWSETELIHKVESVFGTPPYRKSRLTDINT